MPNFKFHGIQSLSNMIPTYLSILISPFYIHNFSGQAESNFLEFPRHNSFPLSMLRMTYSLCSNAYVLARISQMKALQQFSWFLSPDEVLPSFDSSRDLFMPLSGMSTLCCSYWYYLSSSLIDNDLHNFAPCTPS